MRRIPLALWGPRSTRGGSILVHIPAYLPPPDEGGPIEPGGETLPDEPEPVPGAVRWAPGAADGVLPHHGRPGTAGAPEAADEPFPLICASLEALRTWGRAVWPPEAEPLVRAAAKSDPDDGIRVLARTMLS